MFDFGECCFVPSVLTYNIRCVTVLHKMYDSVVCILLFVHEHDVQVNIENPLSASQVCIMQHFVGYLRARMRETCQHGMVVW